jgi:hypothetical protein
MNRNAKKYEAHEGDCRSLRVLHSLRAFAFQNVLFFMRRFYQAAATEPLKCSLMKDFTSSE